MKIYLVGDAASGKSATLQWLSKQGDQRFTLYPEEGHQTVPPILEANKFFGYLWFYLYYYNRDCSIAEDTIAIIERGLSEDYALLEACFRTGKINAQERDIMRYVIDRMMADLPIQRDDLVIILTCRNDIIRQRLEARGRRQGPEKDTYWNIYRDALKDFYIGKCSWWTIDTSDLLTEEMSRQIYDRILTHLKEYHR